MAVIGAVLLKDSFMYRLEVTMRDFTAFTYADAAMVCKEKSFLNSTKTRSA